MRNDLKDYRHIGEAQFAKANGWKVRRSFSVDLLISGKCHHGGNYYANYGSYDGRMFDHAEWYRMDGKPVAIVAHNYESSGTELEAFMKGRTDLTLHIPPAGKAASWYYPGGALPMCVTRADYGKVIWPTEEEVAATTEAHRLDRRPTIKDVRTRMIAIRDRFGVEDVKDILRTYGRGARCVSDLDPTRYSNVVRYAERVLSA